MNELDLLNRQINEIENFIKGLKKQQLNYPVDIESEKAIYDGVLVMTNQKYQTPYSLLTPFDSSTEVISLGKKYLLDSKAGRVI